MVAGGSRGWGNNIYFRSCQLKLKGIRKNKRIPGILTFDVFIILSTNTLYKKFVKAERNVIPLGIGDIAPELDGVVDGVTLPASL